MSEVPDYVELIRSIPQFREGLIDVQPLLKGYSSDLKFNVQHKKQHLVVKLFELQQLMSKEQEYHALASVRELGVSCSEPVALGILENKNRGYMILRYIEGDEATDKLPQYSDHIQYRIGEEAGRQLRFIHQIDAPQEMESWDVRKLEKHKRYMNRYLSMEYRLPNDEKLFAFIEKHVHLMQGRPTMLQHDDFHLSNLIVKDEKLTGVIDFNRMDWGDPIHDFLKVGFFSAPVSVPFSIGQIRGYHHDQEPTENFWKLYSLYVAMSVISSVVWIRSVKPDETELMLKLCEQVMKDHRNFEEIIPSWYDQS